MALLAGLVWAAFHPALHNGFVNWDDPEFITRSGMAEGLSWAHVGRLLRGDPPGSAYYPVFRLSLAVDRWLFGLSPAGYHAENVALHGLNAVLVLLLVLRLGQQAGLRHVWPAGLLAASLFAVHPVNVEAVAWVSGRKVLLAVLFALTSLACYLSTGPTPTADGSEQARTAWWNRSCRAASVALFLVAVLSNAVVLALPLLLVLHDRLLRGRAWLLAVGTNVDYLAIAAGAVVLRFTRLHVHEDTIGLTSEPWEWARLTARGLWQQVRALVVPNDLSPVYPQKIGAGLDADFLLGAALVVAMPCLVVALRRRPLPVFWLLWFVLGLAPSAGHHMFRADRHLYFPAIGLFALLGLGAASVLAVSRARWAKAVLGVVCVCVPLVLVPVTQAQCRAWRSSVSLWTHALTLRPHCWASRERLGNALIEQGRYQDAEDQLMAALQQRPDYVPAMVELGRVYLQTGRPEAAGDVFGRAVHLDPYRKQARQYLVGLLMSRQQYVEALALLRDGLQLAPGDASLSNALAWCLATCPVADLRDGSEAVSLAEAACRASLWLQPQPIATLAAAYAETGRFSEAVAAAEQASRLAARTGNVDLVEQIERQAERYRLSNPYHETEWFGVR